MPTVTGLTAARMLAIEAAAIIDGEVINGNLILTKHDGTTIDAGPVIGPVGPQGPQGIAQSPIPGEVKLWPGSALPQQVQYGNWAWANGGIFTIATYPNAAANIDIAWNTAMGQVPPGAGKFRVPDLRGLVPAGLDAMPVGSPRANRMTRTVAITLAAKTGEEVHVITVNEMPSHDHLPLTAMAYATGPGGSSQFNLIPPHNQVGSGVNLVQSMGSRGGNASHENIQPTIMVPYIVKLDDPLP